MAFNLHNKKYKYKNTKRYAKYQQIDYRTNNISLLVDVLTHGHRRLPRGHDIYPFILTVISIQQILFVSIAKKFV